MVYKVKGQYLFIKKNIGEIGGTNSFETFVYIYPTNTSKLNMSADNPILNSPYEAPKLHYATIATGPEKGSIDYTNIVKGRRVFDPDTEGQAIPNKKTSQQVDLLKDKTQS